MCVCLFESVCVQVCVCVFEREMAREKEQRPLRARRRRRSLPVVRRVHTLHTACSVLCAVFKFQGVGCRV